jgi:MFS family permease
VPPKKCCKVNIVTEFWENPLFRKDFLLCCGIYASIQAMYYGILLKVEYIDANNIFLIVNLMFATEIISDPLNGWLCQVYGRVNVLFYNYILAAVSCVGIIVLFNYLYLKIFFTCSFFFAISACYTVYAVYAPELFDVNIRATASGYVKLIGKVSSAFLPHIITLIGNPITLFFGISVVEVVILWFCRETLKHEVQDIQYKKL